jgi:hypothetical protein
MAIRLVSGVVRRFKRSLFTVSEIGCDNELVAASGGGGCGILKISVIFYYIFFTCYFLKLKGGIIGIIAA